MAKLTKENYERLVSILASHNASDDLARSMADYFEEDNPLFKRDLFMKRFLLKREVSQKIAETHNHINSMHSQVVKCYKCQKVLDTKKVNYVLSNDQPCCCECGKQDVTPQDYRTIYFRGRGS